MRHTYDNVLPAVRNLKRDSQMRMFKPVRVRCAAGPAHSQTKSKKVVKRRRGGKRAAGGKRVAFGNYGYGDADNYGYGGNIGSNINYAKTMATTNLAGSNRIQAGHGSGAASTRSAGSVFGPISFGVALFALVAGVPNRPL